MKAGSKEVLEGLRRLMEREGVNCYVVPTDDAHGSEYIAPADARRAFLTAFTGSAGTALVLPASAHLFTDGRYFAQASAQLPPEWELMKQGQEGVGTWQEFVAQRGKGLPRGGSGEKLSVGVDPTVLGAEDAAKVSKSLEPHGGSLIPIAENLVDHLWSSARPPRPRRPVYRHPDQYAGQSARDKLSALRSQLVTREKEGSGCKVMGTVVTALDDVAWLFNLRGEGDIAYNPVFWSYAWVPSDSTDAPVLFINEDQLVGGEGGGVKEYLEEEVGVKLQPYDSIWEHLRFIGEAAKSAGESVVISKNASWAVSDALAPGLSAGQKGGLGVVEMTRSLVGDLKAVKNHVEIEGFRRAHRRDGAALVAYFAWLDERLSSPREITEWQAGKELDRFREKYGEGLYRGMSFPTISATGKNAAVIHYQPLSDGESVEEAEGQAGENGEGKKGQVNVKRSDAVKREEVYLCDSGGQYADGTTDVTRTLHFGTPTPEQVRTFTRVLQGHIAIDTAVFPKGTTGYVIDAFARRALWQDGLDYRHGTGHGVGSFLNVHEGPHGIGTRISYNDVPLKEGSTVSNEPGFYKDGSFGIRIENIVLVKKSDTPHNFGGNGYLGFEHFTLCPVQTTMVDVGLLSVGEREWVNGYHREVEEKLAPLLQDDARALAWLKEECRPI